MRHHVYAANRSMTRSLLLRRRRRAADRAAAGRLRFATELGVLDVEPQEIASCRAACAFASSCSTAPARGYVCENYGALFRLPDLGADRLQRPRQSARLPDAGGGVRGPRRRVRAGREVRRQPVVGDDRPLAARRRRPGTATTRRTSTTCAASTTIGSISFDHPDPSIFIVLQSPSDTPGVDTTRLRDLPAAHARDARTRSARRGSTATS